MTQTKKTIEEKILIQIKEHGIKQKPKWQFALHTFFLSAMMLSALILTLYLVAFISLVGDEHELINIFGLGPQFTMVFLKAVPWMLISLLVLIFIVLQILIRYFSFGYKHSVLATLSVTFVLVLVINFILGAFDPRHTIARFGERGNIPLLKEVHSTFRNEKQRDTLRGIITNISGNTYTLETTRGSTTVTFFVASTTHIISEEGPKLGDMVFVVAPRKGDTLQATIIRDETFSASENKRSRPLPPTDFKQRPINSNPLPQ